MLVDECPLQQGSSSVLIDDRLPRVIEGVLLVFFSPFLGIIPSDLGVIAPLGNSCGEPQGIVLDRKDHPGM